MAETTRATSKELKEAFVTGHDGTTAWEVLLVCLSAPVSLACYRALHPLLCKNKFTSILLEAFLVWLPMVLCQTNYLYPLGVGVMGLQAAITGLMALDYKKNASSTSSGAPTSTTNENNNKRLDFLTSYRSSILYLTFIAILAVDFHVFPRRFCKTEVSGFGLMDVGAASFCLSAGLVSARARRRQQTFSLKSLLHTLPLVLIGVIRIIANRELEYQEHVSEYGVHWNFFFTMGILALVPPLLSPFQQQPSWILPATVMTLYQLALSQGGLQNYIDAAPRHCSGEYDSSLSIICYVFAANREGILGCLGYLSLFFFGEWIGTEYLWKSPTTTSQQQQPLGLFKVAAMLWILVGILHGILDVPISRRSTNAAFCLWAAAHNILLLAIVQVTTAIPTSASSTIVPLVWDTVNQYGLLMFLIANLLTGLVNLTVPTLEVGDPMAVAIVFGYICTVGMAALLLDALYTIIVGREKKKEGSAKKDS